MNEIEDLKSNLKDLIIKWQETQRRVYFDVQKEDVPRVVGYIFNDLGARFIIVTGMDTPRGIEMLYHFGLDHLGKVVSVRTFIDGDRPEIESVTPIIKGAGWIEREIHDILGVNFLHHPNLKRLITADDWPEDKYPLRLRPSSGKGPEG
ncbi:MAG TPA: NADH-quinone oxidoreductase subunit C [Candidatus Latescibacteria bacterium]|nr:NADH-quinone oxidoreductase subunit C [Candidatus Latescibacterota bacterium]